MSDKEQFRIERDQVGEEQIPAQLYYGINTARTNKEWLTLGIETNPHLIRAYLCIKAAYAQAHGILGSIEPKIAQAISNACEEMLAQDKGKQFIAEPLQAISGITINTNINEVIANRAEEILGGKAGEYKLIQISKHIDLEQEAFSLFSLCTQLAVLFALSSLEPEILNLERLLRRDALTLAKVLKAAAMPNMQSTTGQWGKRLSVFATDLEIATRRIKESTNSLLEHQDLDNQNISGHNAVLRPGPKDEKTIGKLMLQHLAKSTGFRLKEENLQILNDGQGEFVVSDLVFVSSALKDLANVLSKVAHIAKIAHIGPEEGSPDEVATPTHLQIFADSLHMAAYQAVSNNLSLTFLAQCEQLESGMLMPLLSHNLLSTADLLRAILLGFQKKGLL